MRERDAALGEVARSEQDERQPDRNVDVEDPGPGEVRREHAAEQDADGSAAARRRSPDAERGVALATFPEDRHQEREARGREECAAETLETAEDDERSGRPGQAAERGAEGEERDAADEDAPAAEQVCEAPAEQEEAAEDDCVGGDHPLEARLGKAEIVLDRGQGDVHDRHVEHDHELRGDDQGKSRPAARAAGHGNCGTSHLSPINIVELCHDSTLPP